MTDDLATLAETPDEAAAVDDLLVRITVAAADTIAGVDYASITAWRGAGYTTVAASSALSRAVDDAQHAERAGPCVEAARTAVPVGVPDIAATMSWPGFHRQATRLGLSMSLSVPLFTAGGTAAGVLNLYARRPSALTALTAAVRDVYAEERFVPTQEFDAGSERFLTGLGLALRTRATIQRAVGAVMAHDGCDAAQAGRILLARAAAPGESLFTVARRVIGETVPESGDELRVSTARGADGVTRIVVSGDLAMPVDAEVVARLTAPPDGPAARLELDLSGLTFCDLWGLRILGELRDRTVAAGGQVRVVAASVSMRTLLELTGTASYLGYASGADPVE